MFYLSTNTSSDASVAAESYICLPIAAKLISVRLVPDVSVTANNTNYITVSVVDNASTNIFSQNTQISGGGSLTAGTAVTVALSSSADLEFAAGEKVKLRTSPSGSGVISAFTVVYEFEPSRGL
mgnify:FL=1|tara:strand:+ start:63 stop:434 length:372 start_codon:yes stop_codon:yes gene_type:complete